MSHPPLTVAQLAEHKRLPLEFLNGLGLEDSPAGVRIPYRARNNQLVAIKRRTALKATEGSYWPKGVGLCAYGLWKLHEPGFDKFLLLRRPQRPARRRRSG